MSSRRSGISFHHPITILLFHVKREESTAIPSLPGERTLLSPEEDYSCSSGEGSPTSGPSGCFGASPSGR